MRLLFAALSLVVASCATTCAAPADCPAASHSTLVPWHTRAWHPPTGSIRAGAGIRFEPDAGAPLGVDELRAIAAARRQALANVPVRRRPDGSRYAVIGGLVRAYTVARVQPDGRLIQECVHSEEQARQRVAAGSKER